MYNQSSLPLQVGTIIQKRIKDMSADEYLEHVKNMKSKGSVNLQTKAHAALMHYIDVETNQELKYKVEQIRTNQTN